MSLTLLLTACGSGSASSGAGGPSGFAAQAAFSIQLAAQASGTCGIPAHEAHLGEPAPTATNPGGRVIDGGNDVEVTCRVSGPTSSYFSVEAEANQGSGPQGTTMLSVKGSLQADGVGQVSIGGYDPIIAGAEAKPSALGGTCDITIVAPQEIAPGRVWASFDCPVFSDIANGDITHCASSGTFVFENCAQD